MWRMCRVPSLNRARPVLFCWREKMSRHLTSILRLAGNRVPQDRMNRMDHAPVTGCHSITSSSLG